MPRPLNLAVISALILCSVVVSPVQAEDRTSKAREVFQLTGAARMATQMFDTIWPQLLGCLAGRNPHIPREVIASVSSATKVEFDANLPTYLTQMEIVYASMLTDEELDAMIAFYGSDIGRRVMDKMPALMAQSTALGQVWAIQVTPKIVNRVLEALRAKGYEPKI
ncbi:hypothetical protein A6A04_13000 [Paramagnetospirillum marisnigri]|uniref:DUF2059 domain-containing protein n=1 Tax=Paramagnetospirillum marisnigri TaxID=1285242 RepID=A0A178MUI9_9PROT|nr:DUF2059 domain-containing protein [Paramagnetospirillum marisnigri]OAN53809.1 hypothetical protein A6A04_13000 [Paramagnetospirillum marisnigri]